MFNGRRQPSRGGTSRMTRECQVRICERLGVKFPGPTRQSRRFRDVCVMSALPPTTAVMMQCGERQKGAIRVTSLCDEPRNLFDYIVGECQQRVGIVRPIDLAVLRLTTSSN